MAEINETVREVAVTAHDLPLHCPRPGAPLWARHPRVFLDVLKSDEALCPRGPAPPMQGSRTTCRSG